MLTICFKLHVHLSVFCIVSSKQVTSKLRCIHRSTNHFKMFTTPAATCIISNTEVEVQIQNGYITCIMCNIQYPFVTSQLTFNLNKL